MDVITINRYINLDNLRKLVDGVKKMDIPEEDFNMETFGKLSHLEYRDAINKTKFAKECGTAACFAGHFPYVKGFPPEETDFKNKPAWDIGDDGDVIYAVTRFETFSYPLYIDRVLFYGDSGDLVSRDLYRFLFAPEWADTYGTLKDAIRRAEILFSGIWNPDFEYDDDTTWVLD